MKRNEIRKSDKNNPPPDLSTETKFKGREIERPIKIILLICRQKQTVHNPIEILNNEDGMGYSGQFGMATRKV